MAPTDFGAAHGRRDSSSRTPGDELDVALEDPVQMEEVELLSSLMIQAGQADEPLAQGVVDRLLGISDEPSGQG